MARSFPIEGRAAARLVSPWRDDFRFGARRLSQRIRGRKNKVIYFHRVDDPMCHLMAQSLLPLLAAYDIDLEPRVVERLPADCYSDPARYEAYQIIDSPRIAGHYGLRMPPVLRVPDRLSVQMAALHLSGIKDAQAFLVAAINLGEAVWCGDQAHVRSLCQAADMDDAPIRQNEELLRSFGGYSSGLLVFGGRLYNGIDQLRAFLTDFEGKKSIQARPFVSDDYPALSSGLGARSPLRLDMFFALDCPLSYFAMIKLASLAQKKTFNLRILPVPAGQYTSTPPRQWRIWLMDIARQLRSLDKSFIEKPLIEPTDDAVMRLYSAGLAVKDHHQRLAFFTKASATLWHAGQLMSGKEGIEALYKAVAIAPKDRGTPVSISEVKRQTEMNQSALKMAGLWQTPGFILADEVYFGAGGLDRALVELGR